jgi:hypothetical protein
MHVARYFPSKTAKLITSHDMERFAAYLNETMRETGAMSYR